MKRRSGLAAWSRLLQRQWGAFARDPFALAGVAAPARPAARRRSPAEPGAWLPGIAVGPSGVRHYRLFRPAGIGFGDRLPLLVMLHGCGQTAKAFADSTRMNRVAERERFLVLYPEQDRLANGQGCWNWFDTRSGRAYGEAALIMNAIDQVCLLYPADADRVAIAGLSAGASMAALLARLHPSRFKAVVMHSGVPPGTAHSTLSAFGAMHGWRRTKPVRTAPLATTRTCPPLLVIHGGADAVVAPRNGRAAALSWAAAADASAGAVRSVQRGARYPMAITEFKRSGATVAKLVEVSRLGHAWSGGASGAAYSDGQGPDASRMTWAFAAARFGH